MIWISNVSPSPFWQLFFWSSRVSGFLKTDKHGTSASPKTFWPSRFIFNSMHLCSEALVPWPFHVRKLMELTTSSIWSACSGFPSIFYSPTHPWKSGYFFVFKVHLDTESWFSWIVQLEELGSVTGFLNVNVDLGTKSPPGLKKVHINAERWLLLQILSCLVCHVPKESWQEWQHYTTWKIHNFKRIMY